VDSFIAQTLAKISAKTSESRLKDARDANIFGQK
jgi:hypothetical protein